MDSSQSTVLVVTLGTGRDRTDIAQMVEFSFRKNRADRLWVLASPKTQEETLPCVRERLPDVAMKVHACRPGDEENVEALFVDWHQHWDRDLGEWLPARIVVDFTSGTKPMSAAAFALALAHGADAISYVSGEKDESGRTRQSTRLYAFRPDRVFAHRRIVLAAEHFNAGSYAAARDTVAGLLKKEQLPDEHLRAQARGIHLVAAAYEAWDRFDWKEAASHFHQVAKEWRTWTWADSPAQLAANYEHVRKVQSEKNDYGAALAADLLSNAERCMARQDWDDAVARLYRATEMVAQRQLLQRHGVQNTSDVDPAKLPERMRAGYEKRQQESRNGKLRLGLAEAYGLLKELNDPVGKTFCDAYGPKGQGDLGNALRGRNQSLLAHGAAPIREPTAKALLGHVQSLAREVYGDELAACLNRTCSVQLRVC